MENLYLLAAATSIVALTAYWITGRGRYTRRLSWRQARRAEKAAMEKEDTKPWAQALRWLHVHDGLTFVARRLVVRAQKAAGRLAGAEAAFDVALARYLPALVEFQTASSTLTGSTPVLSPGAGGKMTVALFAGDVAVVAGVLMGANAQLPLAAAAVTALAIATAQFGIGKLLGAAAVRLGALGDESRKVLVASLVALGLLGLSLAGLLFGFELTWAFLVITPALGAAALSVAVHDPQHMRLHRSSVAVRRVRRALEASSRRWGKILGGAAGARTRAALLVVRKVIALEQAVAAAHGITEPEARLTAGDVGVETMLLDDLQAVHLTIQGSKTRLEESLEKMQRLAWRAGSDLEPSRPEIDLSAELSPHIPVPAERNGSHV
jgi:hypothetical protein